MLLNTRSNVFTALKGDMHKIFISRFSELNG